MNTKQFFLFKISLITILIALMAACQPDKDSATIKDSGIVTNNNLDEINPKVDSTLQIIGSWLLSRPSPHTEELINPDSLEYS